MAAIFFGSVGNAHFTKGDFFFLCVLVAVYFGVKYLNKTMKGSEK